MRLGTVIALFVSVQLAGLAEDNTSIVVDGQTITSTAPLVVGDSGSNNTLLVINSGKLTNAYAVIGRQSTARSNQATVSGQGSVWHLQEDLVVGDSGNSNLVRIINGAYAVSRGGGIGRGGSHNVAEVSGAGSAWNLSAFLGIGNTTSNCSLRVLERGHVEAAGCVVGGISAGESSVLVSGQGSLLHIAGIFALGQYGRTNSLEVTHGGSVRCRDLFSGDLTGASGNSIRIHGTNTSVVVFDEMRAGGRLGRCIIEHGAQASVARASISRSNVLQVVGSGSVLLCPSLQFNPGSGSVIAGAAVLVATNSGGAGQVSVVSASMLVSNATMLADVFLMPKEGPSPYPTFDFPSGVVQVRQIRFTEPTEPYRRAVLWRPIQIGDGSNVAALRLLGAEAAPSEASLLVAEKSRLEAEGTLTGSVTNQGTVEVFSSFEAQGHFLNQGRLRLPIFATGTLTSATLVVRSNAILSGVLELIPGGVSPPRSATIPLITWGGWAGQFSNAPDGARVAVRAGTMRVDYTAQGLVLADYQEDLDGDGIDDEWARTHLGHSPLSEAEQNEDPDEDGSPTRAEAIAGTDPKDPADVFRVDTIQEDEEGRIVLRFNYHPNKRYRIWTWHSPGVWSEVAGPSYNIVGQNEAEWLDPGLPAAAARLYRISVE